MPPSAPSRRWPWAGRITCSPGPMPAASGPRRPTRSSRPPSSTVLIPKPTCATSSPASQITPSTGSPSCCPGTSLQNPPRAPQPDRPTSRQAKTAAAVGGRLPAFPGALATNGIAISMDGKGAWRDNVFVERLWRSVKYEEVYLRAYESVGEARNSIGRYLDFYNGRRPHQSLDDATPDKAYFTPLPLRLAA